MIGRLSLLAGHRLQLTAAVLPGSRFFRVSIPKMATKKIINTPNAPAAIGPYSQGVMVANTLYLSGQIGLDPKTGEFVSEDVSVQADQCLKNLGAVLTAAGGDYSDVVKATVLLQDISDFTAVNDVYGKYFTSEEPARAAFQAAALPKGAKVEIEAVAYIASSDSSSSKQ